MTTFAHVRRARFSLSDIYDFLLTWLIRVAGTMLVFISAVYGCLELFGLLPELSDNSESVLDIDRIKELNNALTPEDELDEDLCHSMSQKRG